MEVWGAGAAARRGRGARREAVRAARTDRPAAVARAGRKPLVTAGPLARLPFAVKTAVMTAIPKTAPNCCMVLRVPAALPSIGAGTAFSPEAVTQGRAIEMPTPARTNGAT